MTTQQEDDDVDERNDNTAKAPTTDRVRDTLREAFGLESASDLAMQQELMSGILYNHWIEGPGPEVDVPRWGRHPSWEMSFVGPGGGYEVVHVAVAAERMDALVVLAAERMEARGEGVPELTALAVDLLVHGRARVLREENLLAQASAEPAPVRLALPLSAEEAPGAMPEGTETAEAAEERRLEALAARMAEAMGADPYQVRRRLLGEGSGGP